MLLLVYALVRAPEVGWASAQTTILLTTAGVTLTAFAVNERRSRNPLVPLSIFRLKGLAAADATQLIGFAGFFAMFFFVTLYMQNVLGYSPIQAGAAYLPVTAGFALAAGISSQLFGRIGTRPVIVVGAIVAAAGIYDLSRIPVHGSYVADLLPGLVIMAVGVGSVFVGVATAANAGVPEDRAGLAAGLLNTAQQLGAALGLAVFSALATTRTNDLIAVHVDHADALTSGFQRALLASSIVVLTSALIALRVPS
jgi:predicted MFS family arabinose efflux permease